MEVCIRKARFAKLLNGEGITETASITLWLHGDCLDSLREDVNKEMEAEIFRLKARVAELETDLGAKGFELANALQVAGDLEKKDDLGKQIGEWCGLP